MRTNLLDTGRGRAWLAGALYFSEGAPIGFIWWALPVWLRRRGLEVDTIASLVAVLILPWIFKFLWAPFIDGWRGRGGFRRWIAASQVIMAAALLPLFFLDAVDHAGTWFLLLFVHSVAASTQDASIDALIIHHAPPGEAGRLNGIMQAGMLAGRGLFGGVSLMVAARWGIPVVLAALIASILCTLTLLTMVREKAPPGTGPVQAWKGMATAFRNRTAWAGLAFALTGAAAFEAAGGLSGVFLTDHGVGQDETGFFFAVPVVVAMVLGGLAGGRLADRYGYRRVVSLLVFVVAIITGVLALAGSFSPEPQAYLWIYGTLYFAIGMLTAASYALFMHLTDRQVAATQFSTFMAATNGCESWSVWAAGALVAAGGYGLAFGVLCAVSVAGTAFLYAGPFREERR